MTLATLADVLQPALRDGYAVAGLVCLGWEDMRAYARAAEAEDAPVILQAGPSCRAHTPLPVLGTMMRHLADAARVPVVAHLDHGYSTDDCRAAIDAGFTSVMFDGSRLPFDENVEATAAVAKLAHSAGVSCEGEIGVVGYSGGSASRGTEPEDAASFASATGVDALAISVGNVHLQATGIGRVDEGRVRAIEAVTAVPLVIHGGSGIAIAQRTALAIGSTICKFNIGTELRTVFGNALREVVCRDTSIFDRIEILARTEDPMMEAARQVIRGLRPVR